MKVCILVKGEADYMIICMQKKLGSSDILIYNGFVHIGCIITFSLGQNWACYVLVEHLFFTYIGNICIYLAYLRFSF